jgi:hypothetical protein
LSAVALLAVAAKADNAPPQLLNKTIVLSWIVNTTARGPGGGVGSRQTNFQSLVYVSSAGRLFMRGTRSVNSRQFSGSRTVEFGPGDNTNKQGLAREMRFQGKQLVGHTAFQSGASQLAATFDAGFANCTLKVMFGKSGGAGMRLTGTDGVVYDVISIAATGETCAIRQGNAFADQ